MAASKKPIDWRVMVWAGLADMVIGVGLAAAALSGMLGDEDYTVLAVVGGLLALGGLGLFVWGRNNLSNAGNRRGDLN
ncbi:MAG TPA: hypothetical protein VGB60_04470 [Brevundimonas sp.]|jgi:uncharacterized RDD family membrane protein YckC|uniref:hypothetical protein n=1 Tax=Brevundimonas sp. TaxID=1871086 RepID=UPI002EDAFFC0